MLTFTGLDQALKHIETLEASFKPALLEVAGETLVSLTRERFTTGTDPYGVAWKKSKRAQLEGGQTLRDKGILANSYTWQPTSSETLVYGTNVFYAVTHQEGRVIRAKKAKSLRFMLNGTARFASSVTIPKRPMVPDERGDPQPYDDELKDSLEAALNAMCANLGLTP